MSPENLKQIENAFTTNRDEFATFNASQDASAPKMSTPTIITEDVNSIKKTAVFSPGNEGGDQGPGSESESIICSQSRLSSTHRVTIIFISVYFWLTHTACPTACSSHMLSSLGLYLEYLVIYVGELLDCLIVSLASSYNVETSDL